MLIALLQRTKAYFVAGRCRVHPSQVSRWASGERAPGPRARELLERGSGYGIPAAAWDRERPAPKRPRSAWLG